MAIETVIPCGIGTTRKRGKKKFGNTMGWEQTGNHEYYYRKQREGSRVRSIYVGRGEIAHMISNFESHSTELEKLLTVRKSIEETETEKAKTALDRAVALVQLFTQADTAKCRLSYSPSAMETQKECRSILKK